MLILSTASLHGYDLNHAFAIAKQAGMDGIEIDVRAEYYDSHDAEYLMELSTRYALPIAALSSSIGISPARGEKLVKIALATGASVIVLSPPEMFDFDYKKWLESEMRQLRKDSKVHIAVMNPPTQTVMGILPKYGLSSVTELKTFPDICLDTSNTLGSVELINAYTALRGNIVHVQLSDARPEHDHLGIGSGKLPLESLLTHMGHDAYAGALSLKYTPAALGVGDTDKVLANLAAAQAFVRKYFTPEAVAVPAM